MTGLLWLIPIFPVLGFLINGLVGRLISKKAVAWVACGRIDAFWEIGLAPWDMAAGSLLVREAGGLVADLGGEDKYMDNGRILATNGKLFAAYLKLLHERG